MGRDMGPLQRAFHFIVVLGTAVVVGLTYHLPAQHELLWRVTKEDSLFETATAVTLLLVAGYGASVLLRRTSYELARWQIFLISCGMLACLLAGFEELSWGQRLLGQRAPEFFLEHNWQRETNLHNLMDPAIFSGILYGVIAALFILLPLVYRLGKLDDRLPRLGPIGPLVPDDDLVLVFLYGMSCYYYRIVFPIEWLHVALFFLSIAGVAVLALSRRPLRPGTLVNLALLAGSVAFFYAHRRVFHFNNMQNEIREFVVVYGGAFWLYNWTSAQRRRLATEGDST